VTLILLTLIALVVVLALVLVLALVAVIPCVERFMHRFWGNVLVPQCVILEGGVRTRPSKSNLFGS
jgi:hypothetical protein